MSIGGCHSHEDLEREGGRIMIAPVKLIQIAFDPGNNERQDSMYAIDSEDRLWVRVSGGPWQEDDRPMASLGEHV